MTKIFLRILITVLFLILIFVGYFSLIGFETKRFNNQIKDNLKKINSKIDVKLNEVKIVLDLFDLNIDVKTLGPSVSYNDKLIDIELIKTEISLINLINREFSVSNLFISTKSVKLKDVIAFFRVIKNDNKTELFILENLIRKGYLIADVNLNFDEQGRIKDNFKIQGLVKDASIKVLNKKSINKIDFIFETKNKDLEIKDLGFSYEKLNFNSKKIQFNEKNKFFHIQGQINNNKEKVSDELLKNLFDKFVNVKFENLIFSSENKFFLKISEKFKVLDYGIKSKLNIKELSLKNDLNINNVFPKSQPYLKLKDHMVEIDYKKNNLLIEGIGDFLIQKNYDKAKYKIRKIKDKHFFDIELKLKNNPINLNFLNYQVAEQSETILEFGGEFLKDKLTNIKEIKIKNNSDTITINQLKFTKDYKISSIKSAIFNFTDTQDFKNVFEIENKKKYYNISGKVFNASRLIENLIFKDSKSRDIFQRDLNIKIDLKEVHLSSDHLVYGLKGDLKFKDNKLVNATINSNFNENEKISFTIKTNENQKVMTLFSDYAEPFVKKFNFIKGFENGSLDFYSVKSNNITSSQLKIYDFKLKELPALTKILTLASLQGIADLLKGEGIGFSEFEMNFENKENLMTINEIYAIGPAISILMEGYIEKNKLVSLRGTLVPATTINKVIGSIPIIGDILVGKKTGEGVFGVSFKIKGPPKKLETSVNPIKSLTPRFITRTLEKIKKN